MWINRDAHLNLISKDIQSAKDSPIYLQHSFMNHRFILGDNIRHLKRSNKYDEYYRSSSSTCAQSDTIDSLLRITTYKFEKGNSRATNRKWFFWRSISICVESMAFVLWRRLKPSGSFTQPRVQTFLIWTVNWTLTCRKVGIAEFVELVPIMIQCANIIRMCQHLPNVSYGPSHPVTTYHNIP